MTTRTIDNFKSLREILDYNDKLSDNHKITNNDQSANPFDNFKTYTMHQSPILSISNWNAIFSNKKLFSCIMLMFITIVSQLIFSYLAFALISIQRALFMFHFSQTVNLISSYILPLSLLRGLNEVLEDPYSQLSREVEIFKQLLTCVIVQFFCALISCLALYKVLTTGPFVEQKFSFQQQIDISVNMTIYVMIFQIISFQLTLINLILAIINFYMADKKIRRCFNRIERMQTREDLELMLNHNSTHPNFF